MKYEYRDVLMLHPGFLLLSMSLVDKGGKGGMTESLKDRLEFSYENIGASSYLVIKTGIRDGILDYQVSMTGCNKIERLLQYDIKSINGFAYCYYNITSRLQLSFFLKLRRLLRNEFIKLLADMARTVTDSTGFLLSDSGFLLDSDYIFINPDNLEIAMVYVPIRTEYDSAAAFKEFVQKLILQSAEIDETTGDNFLQRIIAYVRNDLFNLSGFLELLDNMLYCGESKKETVFASDEAAAVASICERPPKPLIKTQYINKKPLAAVLLSQAVLAVIVMLVVKYIKLPGGNSSADYLALLLIVIAADIIIMKNILKGVKADIKPRDGEINTTPPPEEFKPFKELNTSTEGQEIKIMPAASNKTELLGSVKPGFPMLNSRDNPGVHIEIKKPDFVVGRLKEQVDHVCSSPAVGKIHALIIKRNDAWFLKDLNSVNGTFINNSRIASNVEHPLKDGDVVAFANCEYVFNYM